jgi:hypothetical protein
LRPEPLENGVQHDSPLEGIMPTQSVAVYPSFA